MQRIDRIGWEDTGKVIVSKEERQTDSKLILKSTSEQGGVEWRGELWCVAREELVAILMKGIK
jgi:hypothetical protein